MSTKLLPTVKGQKTADWINCQSLFKGEIENPVGVGAFVVKGDFFNVGSLNNPDFIYPIVMSRTPGILLGINTTIFRVKSGDKSKVLFSESIQSGFDSNMLYKGVNISGKKLPPGEYTAVVQCEYQNKSYETEQKFNIYDSKTVNGYFINTDNYTDKLDTRITLTFDSSMPEDMKDYINKLVNTIDPVIRKFSGPPHINFNLNIKYDQKGLSGMNADMSVLNLTSLPKTVRGTDENFDSFFFIEYYHMYHKGTSMSVKYERYSESISQAMKIVIGHYLKQENLREK